MILAVLSAAALVSCAGDRGDKGESMKTEESSGTSSQTAATEAPEDDAPESFNVLAIGNSFTIDTFEYLYGIAESYGAENIYIANAAIGGAGLVNHASVVPAIRQGSDEDAHYGGKDDGEICRD